jgi:hypothetical protein
MRRLTSMGALDTVTLITTMATHRTNRRKARTPCIMGVRTYPTITTIGMVEIMGTRSPSARLSGRSCPFLPWYYSTIWWDGLPYYYANDTYYTWNADQDQYQVVEPPIGIESATEQAPAIGDLFVYPKNGQTEDQKMRDEADCHAAAVKDIGFDPAVSDDGMATAESDRRAVYRRALGACLESRGYSVE